MSLYIHNPYVGLLIKITLDECLCAQRKGKKENNKSSNDIMTPSYSPGQGLANPYQGVEGTKSLSYAKHL